MPHYLKGATIDYGFAALPHAQQRALVSLLEDDVSDHTYETLQRSLVKASNVAGGCRIEAAVRDDLMVDGLLRIENGVAERVVFEHVTGDGRRLGDDDRIVPVDAEEDDAAFLPDSVEDEAAVRALADEIASQRTNRTDEVVAQVATDAGDRFALTFAGPRVAIAPMRCEGDPAARARWRELWMTGTAALLPQKFGETLTFGFPEPIARRIDAWRKGGGSMSWLIEELWTRAYPWTSKLDAAALAKVIGPHADLPRGKHVASVSPLTHFDMLHESARLGTKLSPLVLYAYLLFGGERFTV